MGNLKDSIMNYDFNVDQLNEIKQGLESRLTKEEIAIYAKSEFHWVQMRGKRERIKYSQLLSSKL